MWSAFLSLLYYNVSINQWSRSNIIDQIKKLQRNLCAGQIVLTPPRRHFFLGCPGLLITLFLPYPALINHFNHIIFQCPALFYHTHFSFDPDASLWRGWVQNNLTGTLLLVPFSRLAEIVCQVPMLSNRTVSEVDRKNEKFKVSSVVEHFFLRNVIFWNKH